MIEGMVARNIPREFAERCFNQIEGFGEYGFPESHAASFALLVYASAWIKCRYPDAFAAALLNAQPMGFYAPAQIVRDAREHGVEVRPVDVNLSNYDSTLEPGPPAADHLHSMHREMRGDIRACHALRLGLREVRGLAEKDAHRIVEARQEGAYVSLHDLWMRAGVSPRAIERLADADAFGSLHLTRRQALWRAKGLGRAGDQDALPLFAAAATSHGVGFSEPAVSLPVMPLSEEVVNDYRFLHLSLRPHPAAFLRDSLAERGIIPNEQLRNTPSGRRVSVSGLITVRQRPGSAQGVIFMTIEDETSIANIIVWPNIFERFRSIVLGSRYIAVRGKMQQESGVIHVVAEQLEDLTSLLAQLTPDLPPVEALARADAVKRPQSENREKPPRNAPRFAASSETTAADLDVPARGSAHAPTRRAKSAAPSAQKKSGRREARLPLPGFDAG